MHRDRMKTLESIYNMLRLKNGDAGIKQTDEFIIDKPIR